MEDKQVSFYQNPERKHLVIFSVLWVIGNGLLLLADTDFFTENPFRSDYLLTGFLVVGSTISVLKLFQNYRSS
jgi:hypothetical protein